MAKWKEYTESPGQIEEIKKAGMRGFCVNPNPFPNEEILYNTLGGVRFLSNHSLANGDYFFTNIKQLFKHWGITHYIICNPNHLLT